MKSRYIYNGGEVIYAEEGGEVVIDKREPVNDAGYFVIDDCKPFKSMIDGRIINSKSQYRNHLRENGCVEIGNDSSLKNPVRKPLQSPAGLKEEILKVARQRNFI